MTEKALLGAVLLEPERFHEIVGLVADDFSTDIHRQIFRTMQSLAKDGKTIEPVSLGGDMTYSMSLIDGVPVHHPFEQWTDDIRRESMKRKLKSHAAWLAEAEGSPEELAEEMQTRLLHSCQSVSETSVQSFAMNYLNHIYEVRAGKSKAKPQYGLSYLDGVTTGLSPSEYIIIAARPGNGKSALARQIALHNIAEGRKVSFFTLEVTGEQFVSLCVSVLSKVKFAALRMPRYLPAHILEHVENCLANLSQMPLLLDDASGMNIQQLLTRARRDIARGAELVIVDYLQMLNGEKSKGERERINEISAGLRDLAKQTGVPVIALSQLRRAAPGHENDEPTIYDLKESGNLESDAFTVLLLHRPVGEDGMFNGQDRIIIGKQRFGELAYVEVKFDKDLVMYRERLQ